MLEWLACSFNLLSVAIRHPPSLIPLATVVGVDVYALNGELPAPEPDDLHAPGEDLPPLGAPGLQSLVSRKSDAM